MFLGRSVNSIAVDRTNPLKILAVTGSGTYGVAGVANPTLLPRGIFMSTDGGVTWAKMTSQVLNDPASHVIQDPSTPTTWWVSMLATSGTTGGVQKSINGGTTWTQIAGTGSLPPLDAGATWGRAWITGSNVAGIATLYIGNGMLISGSNYGKVYKSTNGGSTWVEIVAARGFCQGQCSYDQPLLSDPADANTFYTGGAGTSNVNGSGTELTPSLFMRSDNGGTTFTSHVRSADHITALHADVHAIAIWPGQPNRIWVGNDGGVWRSDNKGANWIDVNTNLNITQFSSCDLDPTNPNRAYGGTQDNGTNGYSGTVAWPHLDFGDGGYALIDQVVPNNLVHTYFNQKNNLIGVGYTTAGFATTQSNYSGSFAAPTLNGGNGILLSDDVLFYAPIHLDRGVHDTLYFGTFKLYRASTFFSFPNGAHSIFTALASGQDLTAGTGAISAIETVKNPTAGQNANTIFTGSSDGYVYRSTNGGAGFASFTQVDTAVPLFVSDIIVNPRNPQIVFQSRAGFSTPQHNVRKSINGGTTWTDANSGLPNIPVNALSFDPVFPGQIWAGTDVGVYLSPDNGTTWNPYNAGMPNVQVVDIKANAASHTILACTHGRGAFTLSIDAIFVDDFEGN